MLRRPGQAGSQSAEQKPMVRSQALGDGIFQMPTIASRKLMVASQANGDGVFQMPIVKKIPNLTPIRL